MNSKNEPVEIFHIEGRRSFRVVWLCEELGIPYVLHFTKGDIFASLANIRIGNPPMPVAPSVRYQGRMINESGAILDVLLAREGNGRLVPPVESPDFIGHSQWMHFAEGTLMNRMVLERFVSMVRGIDVDAIPKGYRIGQALPAFTGAWSDYFELSVGVQGMFDFIEAHLQEHPYFGGAAFSAADIMMHYVIRIAKLIAWRDTAAYPGVTRWRKAVEQRPAYERATRTSTPDGADEYGLPLGSPMPFPERPTASPGRST